MRTTAPGTIEMVDLECPVPGSQDGLVPEDACDISITDATLVQMGGMPLGPSGQIRPIVLGHQPAGDMAGAGVGVSGRNAGSGGHQPAGRTVRDHRPAPGRARNGHISLTWPRLTAPAELGIVAAGYFGYALVRLAVRAGQAAAFGQAAKLWEAERWLHVDIGPPLNRIVAAEPALAEVTGYYYGLLHFIVTPLTLAWLYLRRPAAFPRLRSALVVATAGANLVYWTWPVAPPRFAVHGMTDVLARYHILGAGDPRGPDSMVNLYAAMPSLHVAWAIWCAVAVVTATRTRWRHLAWLYPVATTFVVLASANHFVLDAVGGAAIIVLGLLAARGTTARARGPAPPTRHAGIPADLEPNPGTTGTVLASALAGQPAPDTHRAVAAWTPEGNPQPQPRSRSPCPDESAHTVSHRRPARTRP